MERMRIIDNPDLFDFKFIYNSLTTTYWAREYSMEIVEKSFRNSCSKMMFIDNVPVGFGRVVTDYAVFGYIADIFICEEYRSQGLSKILVDSLVYDPCLASLKKWMLVTRDMHKLYEKYGFSSVEHPVRYMEYFPHSEE